jgi:hypothetical protein
MPGHLVSIRVGQVDHLLTIAEAFDLNARLLDGLGKAVAAKLAASNPDQAWVPRATDLVSAPAGLGEGGGR